MRKPIRSLRDNFRHRRIAHSNPLARIPEDVVIGQDVYHSLARSTRRHAGGPDSPRARRLTSVA